MTLYRGRYADRGLHVLVIDTAITYHWPNKMPSYLTPTRAAKILRCSPQFATGYFAAPDSLVIGNGTHCLALAMMLDVLGAEDAAVWQHRNFARAYLYGIPFGTPFDLERAEVDGWLRDQAAKAERSYTAALAAEREMQT